MSNRDTVVRRERIWNRNAAGFCGFCPNRLSPRSKRSCEKCLEANKLSQRKSAKLHKKLQLCSFCSLPIVVGSKAFCKKHLLEHREKRGKWKAWCPGSNGRPPIVV